MAIDSGTRVGPAPRINFSLCPQRKESAFAIGTKSVETWKILNVGAPIGLDGKAALTPEAAGLRYNQPHKLRPFRHVEAF